MQKIVLPFELPELSRRQMLRTGCSVVAFASAMKLLAPLCANAQAQYGVQRKLVWINLSGGWDILETVDPKQSANSKLDLLFPWADAHKLAGSSEDIRVGRHLPGLASLGADTLLIRGLAMGTTSHDAGSVYMDTGILSNSGRVNAASIPSIVASESSATIPIIQLSGGTEPQIDRGLLNPVSLVRAQNLELYRSMYPTEKAQVERRILMLDYLKKSIARVKASQGSNDRLSSLENAEDKIRDQINSGIADKLQLDSSDKALFNNPNTEGQRGSGAGEAFALALKLIKNDLVSCVNMGIGGFDTHSNQDRQLASILPSFDAYLKVFVNELRKADKLSSTLIVLYSDFGRTPKVNGGSGRDHWPVGGAAFIGGGIAGGRAVGGTGTDLLALNTDLATGNPLAPGKGGDQLNPAHLGGAVLKLCIGEAYLPFRSYLSAPACLTQTK